MIQSGQVPAARPVGDEKQAKEASETSQRAAMRPEGGYVDLNLTREGSRRMVLRRDRVEIGNSGIILNAAEGSAVWASLRQLR